MGGSSVQGWELDTVLGCPWDGDKASREWGNEPACKGAMVPEDLSSRHLYGMIIPLIP